MVAKYHSSVIIKMHTGVFYFTVDFSKYSPHYDYIHSLLYKYITNVRRCAEQKATVM